MIIDGNNKPFDSKIIKSAVKSEFISTFADVVDGKNKLLDDAVSQKQISDTIAKQIQNLRKQMDEKGLTNSDETPQRTLPGGGPICYAPQKSLPDGGPICYAPQKSLPHGGPICYAPAP